MRIVIMLLATSGSAVIVQSFGGAVEFIYDGGNYYYSDSLSLPDVESFQGCVAVGFLVMSMYALFLCLTVLVRRRVSCFAGIRSDFDTSIYVLVLDFILQGLLLSMSAWAVHVRSTNGAGWRMNWGNTLAGAAVNLSASCLGFVMFAVSVIANRRRVALLAGSVSSFGFSPSLTTPIQPTQQSSAPSSHL